MLSSKLPDTLIRSGPGVGSLREVNSRLHLHTASLNVFERRLNYPPPLYQSQSPSPSLTAGGEAFILYKSRMSISIERGNRYIGILERGNRTSSGRGRI